ncbi:MAG: UbiA family prenyltransferase [candidate division WOR-3 bacterium]
MIAFISVLVGGWVGQAITFNLSLIIAGLVVGLSMGFGNIMNDYFDIESDLINHPGRPIASGRINQKVALGYALLLAVLALILSIKLGFTLFIITLAANIILFFYSFRLKMSIFANGTVALLCSLAFIYGGLVTENLYALFPALFAFLFHYAREIVKDVLDMKGDRLKKNYSLPLLIGPANALKFASGSMIILMLSLPLPVLFGAFRLRYLIGAFFTLIPLSVFIIVNLFRNPEIKSLKIISTLLKAGMVIGLGLLCLV